MVDYMSNRMIKFCTYVTFYTVVNNLQNSMYWQQFFLYTNNKVQSYTAKQQKERDCLRSISQLYVNNGIPILCNKKLA